MIFSILASVLCLISVARAKNNCECSLFLKDELWLPKYMVMTLKNEFNVDCTNFGKANEDCKNYCSDEIAALNSLYNRDPTILKDYPPAQNIPCVYGRWDTSSFSKVCGSQTFVLTSRSLGPPVCCGNDEKRIWCGSSGNREDEDLNSNLVAEGRKLDLLKDQNDETNNEIDDSFVKQISKPAKKTESVGTKLIPPGAQSWFQTFLTFFGYNTFSDAVKGIDIFSIPTKVQAAVRTYKDEVSLGRCYMEFTTFKVFTKQENPFGDLLRRKRSSEGSAPITGFDEHVDDYETVNVNTSPKEPVKKTGFTPQSVKKIVNNLSNVMKKSETTRQYADLLTSVLPALTQLVSNDAGPTSPASILVQFIGPLLAQMGSKKPGHQNHHVIKDPTPVTRYPTDSTPSSDSSSQFTSMALDVIGNLVSNFFGAPKPQNRFETPAPTTTRPTQPSTHAPPSDFASSGIRNILKLFLQGAASSAPVARPIETPRPSPKPNLVDQSLNTEKREEARFIDMLLELIRPVFISIVGNAPGDSGVKDIRRVSTLSTLGRVDDTLREEVDSPFFCFKKYMVNKAWSVTENGVRSVVSTFTPEEQARMLRRISSK